ncbi:MAG: high frequency lysogenization protein HflD [Methylococcales bacterium]
MKKNLHNQVIALAGLTQASYLVKQIATKGTADQEAIEASIASVLKIDADTVEDVYGGLHGVATGLNLMKSQFSSRENVDRDIARYATSLVFLEKKLRGNKKMQDAIRIAVEKAQAQSEHFGVTHENVLANLADVYANTISKLALRIIVNGEQVYLSAPDNQSRIRSLLLAGIRSALLWRQCGGSRWKFLFQRSGLISTTNDLVDKLARTPKLN